MSQPPIAKFADVFGRVNAYIGCVVFYVIGYIIVASSNNIGKFISAWIYMGEESLSSSDVRRG